MELSKRLLVIGSVCAAVSSCGFFGGDRGPFRNRGKDYLHAEPVQDIRVPEGMHQPDLQALYPIPDVQARDEFGDAYRLRDYDIPRPNPINSDEQNYGIKIQKLQDERWLAVNAPTSQVWPRTQSFLSNAGIAVTKSSAQDGVIETDWLQYTGELNESDESVLTDADGKAAHTAADGEVEQAAASSGASVIARFRLRLEKGVQPGTTEIHIREFQVPVGTELSMPMQWPDKSVDPARERWFMRKLAQHLGETIDNASASLLGQNVGGETKVRFGKRGAEPALEFSLSRARAWASLLGATDKENFRLWEVDEQHGLMLVGYHPKLAKKEGFWGRLWPGKPRRLPKRAPHDLAEIVRHLDDAQAVKDTFAGIPGAASGAPLKKLSRAYLLLMSPADDENVSVIIRDARGRALPSDEAKMRLRMLRTNLI